MAKKSLSPSEIVTLRLLEQGFNYYEVANRLGISRNTVQTQVVDIGRKLHVSGREAILQAAKAEGLV